MAVPQKKFREIVFQMLYSFDMSHAKDEDMIELLMKELEVTKKTVILAQENVKKILSHLKEIDELIAKNSRSYEFERIQSVERNILRIGIYEVFFDSSIPPKVAISESIRLSRKFGTPEAASFVNAILDTAYKTSMGEQVDQENVKEAVKTLVESEETARDVFRESLEDPIG